jgi:predicted nucleotidyltransferase
MYEGTLYHISDQPDIARFESRPAPSLPMTTPMTNIPITRLALDTLPDLPQCSHLALVASALWQQEGVMALWLGGSLARGEGDLYSDVDLRLAVTQETLEHWRQPDLDTLLAGPCQVKVFLSFGETAFLHHLLLSNGDIYDLWVQSIERSPSPEAILILGCRDAGLEKRLEQIVPPPAALPDPPDPAVMEQVLREFWFNSHKHRRVLHRNLDLLAMTGIQVDRSYLLRLWYALATGNDCGPLQTQSIFGLTNLMRTVAQAQGATALEVLGAPLSDRSQILHTITLLRDEAAKAGRLLARQLGFPYPQTLEQTVRQGWADFLPLESDG